MYDTLFEVTTATLLKLTAREPTLEEIVYLRQPAFLTFHQDWPIATALPHAEHEDRAYHRNNFATPHTSLHYLVYYPVPDVKRIKLAFLATRGEADLWRCGLWQHSSVDETGLIDRLAQEGILLKGS